MTLARQIGGLLTVAAIAAGSSAQNATAEQTCLPDPLRNGQSGQIIAGQLADAIDGAVERKLAAGDIDPNLCLNIEEVWEVSLPSFRVNLLGEMQFYGGKHAYFQMMHTSKRLLKT